MLVITGLISFWMVSKYAGENATCLYRYARPLGDNTSGDGIASRDRLDHTLDIIALVAAIIASRQLKAHTWFYRGLLGTSFSSSCWSIYRRLKRFGACCRS
jgi:hypothetical protein